MPPIQLNVGHVTKEYKNHRVLDGVDFCLEGGQRMGIMGPSGIGKSTLARIVVGLERPDSGYVLWNGSSIADKKVRRQFRRKVQLMVQDPTAALNPLKSVRRLIEEIPGFKDRAIEDREETIVRYLDMVGLNPNILSYRPGELSGGMNQRLLLTRLLLNKPELIIFDEPTTGLDLSLQASILHLIKRMQRRYGFTYLLISHDIDIVRFMCERIGHIHQGRLYEYG